jgi:hypothetical protein
MPKSNRSALLASIASTIADYRQGEITAPDSEHVNKWISQFDAEVQEPILAELDHVLKNTYIPKPEVERFLSKVLNDPKLAGADPCAFWKAVGPLAIQQGGNSQREMLAMFDQLLQKECGLQLDHCHSASDTYFYLDDVVFSGNRVKRDLATWIESDAPKEACVHIIVIAYHTNGRYYAETGLQEAAAKAQKRINLTWWACVQFEDQKRRVDSSEVLRPSMLPTDSNTQSYVAMLTASGFPPVLRTAGLLGISRVFSSEVGRGLLEQEFLKWGLLIRSRCPYLPVNCRPLGYSVLKTLGFGSLVVTFRNCPNNCPLVFWAGEPWYPLFPRKTN